MCDGENATPNPTDSNLAKLKDILESKFCVSSDEIENFNILSPDEKTAALLDKFEEKLRTYDFVQNALNRLDAVADTLESSPFYSTRDGLKQPTKTALPVESNDNLTPATNEECSAENDKKSKSVTGTVGQSGSAPAITRNLEVDKRYPCVTVVLILMIILIPIISILLSNCNCKKYSNANLEITRTQSTKTTEQKQEQSDSQTITEDKKGTGQVQEEEAYVTQHKSGAIQLQAHYFRTDYIRMCAVIMLFIGYLFLVVLACWSIYVWHQECKRIRKEKLLVRHREHLNELLRLPKVDNQILKRFQEEMMKLELDLDE